MPSQEDDEPTQFIPIGPLAPWTRAPPSPAPLAVAAHTEGGMVLLLLGGIVALSGLDLVLAIGVVYSIWARHGHR